MPDGLQFLGVGILVAVFGVFYAATVQMEGWRMATLAWLGSAAITGLVVLGLFLALGGA